MAKAKNNKIIVGLDIGTTKICTIVGELVDSNLEIIGVGIAPSKGIRKGVVINIDETVEAIKKSVQEAEMMSGSRISSVYVGIAGGHIKSYNSTGVIAIKNRIVTENDKRRVIDAAQAINIPLDREILHVLPQEYIVDNQDGIDEPLGMSGVRLEVKVHVVTGAVSAIQNIIKCCKKAGLDVKNIVLEQLAASDAVLTEDEKNLGVALIDLGGGTTDIAIFHRGSIKYSSVLAMGGSHVTNDIAIGLRTPTLEAENLKIKYGCALSSLVNKEDMIEVPTAGSRKNKLVPRTTLADIIEPRMEEIFTLVNREIIKSEMEQYITSGIVLTGGSALLEGTVELAENIFNLPVRLGVPKITGVVESISSPQLSTAVGLVLHGIKSDLRTMPSKKEPKEGWNFGKIVERLKEILKEFFE
ncbi:MAG: cell division protein FtsA [bacterium]